MTTKTKRRFVGGVEGLERRESMSGFMATPGVAVQVSGPVSQAVVTVVPSAFSGERRQPRGVCGNGWIRR